MERMEAHDGSVALVGDRGAGGHDGDAGDVAGAGDIVDELVALLVVVAYLALGFGLGWHMGAASTAARVLNWG